ncbi:queuosine precursor transporter [Halomicrobium salinisoli]|uniref:queuosine precursor transporter n=1 Tax=Halomicrobium salinisoli TaxID=2878391 RepID=UPI001CEFC39D|nr:queuosine precursor transporter [Halomicrobium salinisoli]
MTSGESPLRIGLVALFMTALATAQLTASKVLMFELPFALPIAGSSLVLPGAALAYALTFLASDCYAELYGRRAATVVVNVGFVMNFVLLALVWSTILSPIFPDSPVGAAEFRSVMASSTGVVVGSLFAYVVSQNWDVFVFHRLREYTDGEALWLRNIGSTASSQLIDTAIFVTVAFVVFQGLPPQAALALGVGQYVLKLLIALLDTPVVYAIVGAARRADPDLRAVHAD